MLVGTRMTPMFFRMMYKRRVVEVLLDLCLVSCAYYAAFRLKFEGAQIFSLNDAVVFAKSIVTGVVLTLLTVVYVRRGHGRSVVVYGAEKPGSLLARELLAGEVQPLVP